MFDLDKWQEIFHSIVQNPLRTIMTALGVFWGILMLVLIIGAANGLENGVNKRMGMRASNSMFVWSRRTSLAYAGFQPGRSIRMNNGDIEVIKALIHEAEYVCPRNQLGGFRGGNNVIYKNKTGAFEVMGDYPEIRHVELFKMDQGRFLNQKDLIDNRKVAVIGQAVKELMYEADEDPVGTWIQIQGSYFQVVGVFSSTQSGNRAEREMQRIYIPFSTFQKAFNYGNRVSWFAITAKRNISVSVVEEKVLSLLRRRHEVSPDDSRAFGHFNLEEEFQEAVNVLFGINTLGWIVGILTLLAGAIGISNIMLVIVKERTKEIGIRRAIGAKPINITSQIISEAVILTFLAGYAGLVLGVAILELISWGMISSGVDTGMFGPPTIEIGLALKALGALIVAGIFAGLLPARKAISISPVDALRAD